MGSKENSEGKNVFWYGYKAHLAVGTKSQYIIQSLFSSGNLNDGKAAIPLLKGIHELVPLSTIRYHTMDAGMISNPFINNMIGVIARLLRTISEMSQNR